MSAEFLPPEVSVPETYRKHYNVKVEFSGLIPTYPADGKITTGSQVWGVVFELLSNCVENRIPESDIGAKKITVTFQPGQVTVEDDFVYEEPEPVLERILAIRDSGKPFTTKPPEDGYTAGGCGIYTSTKTIRELGGNLDYHIKDGTIVAVATWVA
jgi:hypothetical protein